MMETVVIVLLAYLIGAVPSGYLIGRIFYGVDLKKTEAEISEQRTRTVHLE